MTSKIAAKTSEAWCLAWGRLLQVADRHPRLVIRAARALVKTRDPRMCRRCDLFERCDAHIAFLCLLQPSLSQAGVRAHGRDVEQAMDEVAPALAAAVRGYKSERARRAAVGEAFN